MLYYNKAFEQRDFKKNIQNKKNMHILQGARHGGL